MSNRSHWAAHRSDGSEGQGWEPPGAHCDVNVDGVEDPRDIPTVDYAEDDEPMMLRGIAWFRMLSRNSTPQTSAADEVTTR